MLLRSSSTPILNPWTSSSKESSTEPEGVPQIRRIRSISLTKSTGSFASAEGSAKKMSRALSKTDLLELSLSKQKPITKTVNPFSLLPVGERQEEDLCSTSKTASLGELLWSCGSDEESEGVCVGGGSEGSGGSDGGGGEGSSGYGDSNNGNDSIDAYYRKMIEANPGNTLLLGNYARFLKEVRRDFIKAEEYCRRAILANPNDGHVLCLYADLLWQTHKDAQRAENYFNQAVKAFPNDCYVLASYARFLWDAEEEAEEEEEKEKGEAKKETSSDSSRCFLQGAPPPPPPPLAAVS